MNNLKLPAYPQPMVMNDQGERYTTEDFDREQAGFTKLELASLMIAQGLCADATMDSVNVIPEMSVKIAKAILEECNK